MTDDYLDDEIVDEPPHRPWRPDWLLAILIKPRRTLREIMRAEGPTWLAPLAVLSLMAILTVVISAPLRIQQAQSQPPNLPADFQYWDMDTQQKYLEANQPNTGAAAIYILPGMMAVAGVWLSWLILSAVLHLGLTMAGTGGNRGSDTNLAAWASLPFAARGLVQLLAMLFSQRLIMAQGLSGFAPAEGNGFGLFFSLLLRFVDLYLIWHFVLLVLGASSEERMPVGKALGVILACLLVVLSIQALPAFLGAQLGGLSVQRPFFF